MTSVNVTLAQLVLHKGEVVSEYYGPEVTAATSLISWSMAKCITHALVGIAQMDGLLHTENHDLFPEWANDERRAITLQQLLEMRSGLSWIEDYVDGDASDVIEMLNHSRQTLGPNGCIRRVRPISSRDCSAMCSVMLRDRMRKWSTSCARGCLAQ